MNVHRQVSETRVEPRTFSLVDGIRDEDRQLLDGSRICGQGVCIPWRRFEHGDWGQGVVKGKTTLQNTRVGPFDLFTGLCGSGEKHVFISQSRFRQRHFEIAETVALTCRPHVGIISANRLEIVPRQNERRDFWP